MSEQTLAENEWKLTIKSLSQRKEISIPAGCGVQKLREEVAKLFEVDEAQTCLIFGGKILKDTENLQDHGISENSTVHLVIRPKRADNPQPSTPELSQSVSEQPAPTSVPDLGSPLGSLGNLAFGNGNFNEIQQGLFQSLQNDPNAMQNILNNPMVQGLMSNPELLRSMMMNNPQMQRVIEQNPEVSQFFNNPDFMRQTMEMLRNPTTLQEIMRNHDRALINLESLPGGYNALQRIYRDFQEPMINATQEQFGYNPLAPSADSNRPASSSQAGTENTDPLPNPWASTTNNTNTAGTSALPSAFPQIPANIFNPGSTNASWITSDMQDLIRQAADNPRLLSNIMSSPHIAPLLDNYAQDPQVLRELISSNPIARNDPQLRDQMLRAIPAFINQWSVPEVRALYSNQEALSAILQIQQGILRLQNAAPEIANRLTSMNFDVLVNAQTAPTGQINQTPGAEQQTASASNIPLPVAQPSTLTADSAAQPRDTSQEYTTALFQLLNLLTPQQSSNMPANPTPTYTAELEQMQLMGFNNRDANLRALIACMGDVNLAVEQILEQRNQNFNPPRS